VLEVCKDEDEDVHSMRVSHTSACPQPFNSTTIMSRLVKQAEELLAACGEDEGGGQEAASAARPAATAAPTTTGVGMTGGDTHAQVSATAAGEVVADVDSPRAQDRQGSAVQRSRAAVSDSSSSGLVGDSGSSGAVHDGGSHVSSSSAASALLRRVYLCVCVCVCTW
jgi:hypothetical protein